MIHNIRFRFFIYHFEDENEILDGLSYFLPLDIFEKEMAEGMDEKPIAIYTGTISKKKEIKSFINKILGSDIDFNKFQEDLEKKMDDKGNLFLRFSKSKIIEEKLEVTQSGDSIHLKVKIAAYPAKKDVAIKIAKKLFNNGSIVNIDNNA
ncbi:MAG: exosome protein [Methanobrevibacter sp.]|nr:exosome protein [Candidatus Methanoflexus mossambicus]